MGAKPVRKVGSRIQAERGELYRSIPAWAELGVEAGGA